MLGECSVNWRAMSSNEIIMSYFCHKVYYDMLNTWWRRNGAWKCWIQRRAAAEMREAGAIRNTRKVPISRADVIVSDAPKSPICVSVWKCRTKWFSSSQTFVWHRSCCKNPTGPALEARLQLPCSDVTLHAALKQISSSFLYIRLCTEDRVEGGALQKMCKKPINLFGAICLSFLYKKKRMNVIMVNMFSMRYALKCFSHFFPIKSKEGQ